MAIINMHIVETLFSEEEYLPTSSARCDRSKEVRTDVFLGEKTTVLESSKSALSNTMQPTTADQVSLWCERTQDMSGYVFPTDNTLRPLGERVHPTLNAAQIENDFYVQQQHSGNSSPDFILGDQSETVLGIESEMFANNYSELNTKIEAWLDIKNSAVEMNDFAQNGMFKENGLFQPLDSESSPIFLEDPKVDKKPSATVKKPGYLSIFDSEEPHITGDLDNSICCTDNKMAYDMKYEMDIAEEVEVTTEESGSDSSPFSFKTPSPEEFLVEPKEETAVAKQDKSPLRNSSIMEMSFDLNSAFDDDDEFMVDLPPWEFSTASVITPSTQKTRVSPPRGLHLDIDVAMDVSKQLLVGTLPDTPDVLKPVLVPQQDFDLVDFLLTNGDSNNNAIVLPSPLLACNEKLQYQSPEKSQLVLHDYQRRQGKPSAATGKSLSTRRPTSTTSKSPTPRKPSTSRKPSAATGKPPASRHSLVVTQKPSTGKPSFLGFETIPVQPEPVPSTSAEFTVTGRPARKSATKFKKLLEEGFLDPSDNQSISSDDEDSSPQKKRRRTISSSSSRRRLYSDSDRSSICEDAQKYRQRRDKNNISSQKSRQKRKALFEQQKEELQLLEVDNKRLKKRAKELADVVDRVHQLWKVYLESIKRN